MSVAHPVMHDSSPLATLRLALREHASAADATVLQRFFKTAPGEYGEGDRFLGVRVPTLRRLARQHSALPRADVLHLLRSAWHEERLLALLLLVQASARGDRQDRESIYRAYLANTRHVNNWDLVDSSAEHIVGPQVRTDDLAPLEQLARSPDLWERRIAILATFHFIKRGEFAPTLRISRLLLTDPHDLIHKAVGWMLREVGKRRLDVEEAFLRQHYRAMPRTMLRYAIERFPEARRRQYLAGEV